MILITILIFYQDNQLSLYVNKLKATIRPRVLLYLVLLRLRFFIQYPRQNEDLTDNSFKNGILSSSLKVIQPSVWIYYMSQNCSYFDTILRVYCIKCKLLI